MLQIMVCCSKQISLTSYSTQSCNRCNHFETCKTAVPNQGLCGFEFQRYTTTYILEALKSSPPCAYLPVPSHLQLTGLVKQLERGSRAPACQSLALRTHQQLQVSAHCPLSAVFNAECRQIYLHSIL